jgi:malate permease and related proteins
MNILLNAIVPVSFIILLGLITGKILKLERQSLSQITLFILSPALIIDSLYRSDLSFKTTLNLLTSYAISSLVLYLIVLAIVKINQIPSGQAKALIATILFSNNGNLGLPFVAFALGENGLKRAIIYTIASSILMYGLAPAMLTGKGLGYGLKLTLKLPLLWSIIVGFSLYFFDFKLPFKIDESIRQVGAAAIPIALLILGMELANTKIKVGKAEIIVAILRLVISPVIAYIIGKMLSLETLDLQVLILQSAMPTAVSTIVLVSEFGGDTAAVTRSIVLSTVLSLITLPIVLFLVIS